MEPSVTSNLKREMEDLTKLKPMYRGEGNIPIRIPALGKTVLIAADEYYDELERVSRALLISQKDFISSLTGIEDEDHRNQAIAVLCDMNHSVARSHILGLIGTYAEDAVTGVTLQTMEPKPLPTEPVVRANPTPEEGYRQD